MRRFELVRTRDVSGVSGTGVVADGVEFPDGLVFLRWRGRVRSYSFFENGVPEMLEIHGHGGATRVRWIDS